MLAVYAHVSNEAQRENVERQITNGTNWAMQMNSEAVVYADIGGRRELERLLAECEAGKVQCIWVDRWSCLSRNLESLEEIRVRLSKTKVQVQVGDA